MQDTQASFGLFHFPVAWPAPRPVSPPRHVAMRPTPVAIPVLTACPVSKGPLRLGNLYSKIISNFGVMSRITKGVGLSLTVTKPFRTP